MFTLLVLSGLLAAAVAEPQLISTLLAPATYTATIAAPATTSTYVQHSSYVAPTVYSDIAYPHFIKKRSPQFLSSYVAPYLAGAPLVTPYASAYVAPTAITYSSAVLPAVAAPAHFIKKRSATLIASLLGANAPPASNNNAPTPLAPTYSPAIIPSAPHNSLYYSNYLSNLRLLKK